MINFGPLENPYHILAYIIQTRLQKYGTDELQRTDFYHDVYFIQAFLQAVYNQENYRTVLIKTLKARDHKNRSGLYLFLIIDDLTTTKLLFDVANSFDEIYKVFQKRWDNEKWEPIRQLISYYNKDSTLTEEIKDFYCTHQKYSKNAIQKRLTLYLNHISRDGKDNSNLSTHLQISGHCFGFSLCYAAMFIIDRGDWWLKILKTIISWDCNIASLNSPVTFTYKYFGRNLIFNATRAEIFARVLNYIVYHQATFFNMEQHGPDGSLATL